MADGQQPVEGQLLMQMKSFQPVLSQSPESTAPSVEQLMEETANLSNDLTSANLVLVSNTFNATLRMDGVLPNIIIFSSDNTFFLVHYHILSSMSNNHFGGLVLPEHEDTCTDLDCDALELYLPEPASVLNVVLCTVYDLSSDVYHPTLDSLAESIEAMKKYGLPLHPPFTQSRPLYNTFLCHVALHPFEVYTLAAENNLEDLAAVASSYTLTHCIHDAPRDLVSRMGAHYLFRLFDLHWTRMDTLRRMFDVRLYPHSPKSYCSQQNRMVVARAFHLAGMQIFYTASAGIAGAEIKKTMDDLAESLSCTDCKNTVQKRVAEIIRHWVLLQRTI